ncbi:hypothetical protein [Streptomyces sp. NPDC015680]|uniref:hypothetical protein n=1 Tax=Streptomyces sp. NPDC015680 TaxID=3364962 RepID=UPI0037021221
MPGHSSITTTSDTYTSLLPEADPAIAEAAARLAPRARATSEDTGREARAHRGELVLDDADPLGNIPEINSPSAHAPHTQTAPDEESEAEQSPSLGEKPQVRAVMLGAPPGRIRTCDTRFRSSILPSLVLSGRLVRQPSRRAAVCRRPASLVSALDVILTGPSEDGTKGTTASRRGHR